MRQGGRNCRVPAIARWRAISSSDLWFFFFFPLRFDSKVSGANSDMSSCCRSMRCVTELKGKRIYHESFVF